MRSGIVNTIDIVEESSIATDLAVSLHTVGIASQSASDVHSQIVQTFGSFADWILVLPPDSLGEILNPSVYNLVGEWFRDDDVIASLVEKFTELLLGVVVYDQVQLGAKYLAYLISLSSVLDDISFGELLQGIMDNFSLEYPNFVYNQGSEDDQGISLEFSMMWAYFYNMGINMDKFILYLGEGGDPYYHMLKYYVRDSSLFEDLNRS
jgi:hypothetical protein